MSPKKRQLLTLLLFLMCSIGLSNIDSLRYALLTETNPEVQTKLVDQYLNQVQNLNLDTIILICDDLIQISQKTQNAYGEIKANYNAGLSASFKTDYQTALNRYRQGLNKALKTLDTTHIITGYRVIGNIYLRSGVKDSMFYYTNKAIKLAKACNETHELAAAYIDLASHYHDSFQHDSTLFYYLESLALFEETKNFEGQAVVLGNLGNLFNSMEDYELAKEHIYKAIKINKVKNNQIELSNNYNNLGIAYQETNMLDSASWSYNKCIEINNELGDVRSNAIAYNNLGNLYIKKQNYSLSKDYFDISLHICDSLNISIGRYYNLKGLGDLYFDIDELDMADSYYQQCIDLASQFGVHNLKTEPLLNLYSIYKSKQNYEKALQYHEEYLAIYDSIVESENQAVIDQYKVLFQTEQKNNQILQQQVRIEQKEKEYELSRVKSQRLLILFSTSILLIFVIIIAYFRLRNLLNNTKRQSEIIKNNNEQFKTYAKEISIQSSQLKVQNKKLEELTEFRDNIVSTMVHDLKTPLNSIIGLSSMPPNEEMQEHIHYSGKNMMNLVSNILDVQRAKTKQLNVKPENVNIEECINDAMKDVYLDISMKKQTLEKHIKVTNITADNQLLRRIIVNILSNAIKYSPSKSTIRIDVTPEQSNELIRFAITDQGEGIKEEHIENLFVQYANFNPKSIGMSYSTGIGLSFCKIAVEAMQGKIGIDSTVGIGTTVWFTLPT